MEVHPAAKLFPMLKEAELDALAADVKKHGLLEDIVTHEGLLLDGRNRLAACKLAGVTPRFRKWGGVGAPADFVVSKNLHRRQLTKGERVVAASELAVMLKDEGIIPQRPIGRHDNVGVNPFAIAAAERFGVGVRSVVRTLKIMRDTPYLLPAIKEDKLTAWSATVLANKERPTMNQVEKVELVRRMAAEGHTYQQVASEVGMTHGGLWNLAKSKGIAFPATIARKSRRINMARIIGEIVLSGQGIESNVSLLDSCDDVGFESFDKKAWLKSLNKSAAALRMLIKLLKTMEVPIGNQETK